MLWRRYPRQHLSPQSPLFPQKPSLEPSVCQYGGRPRRLRFGRQAGASRMQLMGIL
jgi:hypothetical protein